MEVVKVDLFDQEEERMVKVLPIEWLKVEAGSLVVGLDQFGLVHDLLYHPLQGKRYGEGMVQKVVEKCENVALRIEYINQCRCSD